MNGSANPAAERLYFIFTHVGIGGEDVLGLLDQALLIERRQAESGAIDMLRDLVRQIVAANLPPSPALVAARQLLDQQLQPDSASEQTDGAEKQ